MTRFATRERVEQAIDRAGTDAARGVFIGSFAAEAREAADALDVQPPHAARSPLFGVPVTVKDNFDIRGRPTTAGSRLLADAAPAREDATAVKRLRGAGAVVLGRTNMTEFAFSGLGLNPHYGTPANPAYPGERHIPGGSSSGAAVSVALGIAPYALGTDTGGSVRIPAALCGLTGFKPTASAVSRDGVLPLSSSLDSVGVIARTVRDCATIFDVIRDLPSRRRHQVPARRIRLGAVENYVMDECEPEVRRAFEEGLAALEQGGVAVERVRLEILDEIPAMTREATFPASEAYAWHQAFLESERVSEYDPRVLSRIRNGGAMSAAGYIGLTAHRRRLIAEVEAQAAGLDALAWPTVPFVAPALDSLKADEAYYKANQLALRNSTIANLLDGCAISIPCPSAAAGPVGLTLAAQTGLDDHLLSIAAACQAIWEGK